MFAEYKKALKKYAEFSGRTPRKEYWMFVFYNFIIAIILSIILGILHVSLLIFVYDLFIIFPSVAISMRRLHDTGHSGWWLLIGLVPLVGAVILFVFYVTDSQSGENKYGPNPKGIA